MGPTGTGKSNIAINLAEQYPIEIINADSMQVYRGLDIGTAKVDASIRERIPHHLVDIRDPDQPYSAGDFIIDAHAAIESIHARGHIPLLVGGTGLYFKFLEEGYHHLPASDKSIRQELEKERDERGLSYLWEHLYQIDSDLAKSIDKNDHVRIIRSIEIHRLSGSSRQRCYRQQKPSSYQIKKCLLTVDDRDALRESNHNRVKNMLSSGLIEEVRACESIQKDRQLPASKAVGYRQTLDFFEGKIPLEDLEMRIVHATNQYMKRQLTWFAKETNAKRIGYLSENVVGNVLTYWGF